MSRNKEYLGFVRRDNLLIWNYRSIRDYNNRALIQYFLTSSDIDIAFIQETFMSVNYVLFLRGCRIFMSTNDSWRKRVAILVKQTTGCNRQYRWGFRREICKGQV